MKISKEKIKCAEQILIDNGIEADEASTVLQALGFALLDHDIYSDEYKASSIQWVDPGSRENELPSEVIVAFEDLLLPDNATFDEIKEAMSDYLVDNYDIHNGFKLEYVKNI